MFLYPFFFVVICNFDIFLCLFSIFYTHTRFALVLMKINYCIYVFTQCFCYTFPGTFEQQISLLPYYAILTPQIEKTE